MRHLFVFGLFALSLMLPGPARAQAEQPAVELHTSLGLIVVALDREQAPATVENFLRYVQEGFYNGTIFHRVIAGFMIQGGGFDREMRQKPTHGAIRNEADNGLKNLRLTIAMARTPDPHSATAQFFINTADNAFLNYASQAKWGYCVFGRVVEGGEVVEAIERVRTRNVGSHENVPEVPVVIEKAVIRTP
ncbi:MAG: peptidyl-prolyl cis-trans isomerase [Desulfovibrio sp.]|jgi:cyclophilin family peptidyl-prolyl cis-trans isomerase|nr:peptidyl-prolyl cis-trans isomerase [Desulfovibrio sp.]